MARYHTELQATEGLDDTRARDEEHRAAARCRLRIMDAYGLQPGRLLDVGCGGGAFVSEAADAGWEARGLDPCEDIGKWARAKGRLVDLGDWRDIPRGAFEVITVHDVLEHLTRPAAALEACSRGLVDGGRLIVEMPEANAPFGEWERHLRPLQHIALYGFSAAVEMFRRGGLIVESFHRPKGGALGKVSFTLRSR